MSRDRGLALLQAGDLDGAVRELELVIAVQPTDAEAHGFLGVALARQGEDARAIQLLDKATEMRPDDAELRFNLARTLYQAGEFEDCLEELDFIPEHEKSRALRARLEALAGDPEGGLIYREPTAEEVAQLLRAPSLARRAVRGVAWGMVFGQWWTLWLGFGLVLWGGALDRMVLLVVMVAFFLVYGLCGGLAGLVIGLTNASPGRGAAIGIAAGLCVCALEAFLLQTGNPLLSAVFYFFTGRYVGERIAQRVQLPVRRR